MGVFGNGAEVLPAGRSAQTLPATTTRAGLKFYLQGDVKSVLALCAVTIDGWAWKQCMSCTGMKGAALLVATVLSTQLGATASSETPFCNISRPLENLVPMTDCTILNEIQPFALKLVNSV